MKDIKAMDSITKSYKLPIYYLTILISIMHICNVLAFKVVSLFGIQMAMSGFVFPLAFYFLTALSESYGHKEAQRAIAMVLIAQTILLVGISILVYIPSPLNVASTQLYYELFSSLWRLLISSTLAVGLSFYFSSYSNSRLKIWLLGKHKIIRFIVANGIGKAILVSITYPINFYGILEFQQIMVICVNTWIYKMIIASTISYTIIPLIKFNKKVDKVDMYDLQAAYNPLKSFSIKQSGVNMYGKKIN